MVKKLFLTALVAGFMLGGAAIAQPTPAMACGKCWKAAKAEFPGDRKERKAYRKHCKAEHRAYRKAHRKHWFK